MGLEPVEEISVYTVTDRLLPDHHHCHNDTGFGSDTD